MKRFLIIISILLLFNQSCFSNEIPIKIKPVSKITTSNLNVQEGDFVDFEIKEDIFINSKKLISKGEIIKGLVSKRSENDFYGVASELYIDNFEFEKNKNPYFIKGIIYKKGNAHKEILEFFNPLIIRGGEVQIKPTKDEFILFLVKKPKENKKTSIRIEPTKLISTKHDKIELGDWLPFEVVNDVYLKNTLYLKKHTPIYAKVDYVHPNGWLSDYAEIKFKKFKTKTANGKNITIEYPMTISGNSLKANSCRAGLMVAGMTLLSEVFIFVRGAEIYIEPDTQQFNLFIEQL